MTNEANGGAKFGETLRIGLATFNKGATVLHPLGANPADLDANISKVKFTTRKFTNFEQSFADLKSKMGSSLRRQSRKFVIIFSNGFKSTQFSANDPNYSVIQGTVEKIYLYIIVYINVLPEVALRFFEIKNLEIFDFRLGVFNSEIPNYPKSIRFLFLKGITFLMNIRKHLKILLPRLFGENIMGFKIPSLIFSLDRISNE